MEATTTTKIKVREDSKANDGIWEIQSVATKAVFITMCLVGVWSIACIASAFTAVGPVALVAGLFGAIV